jgi:hypothetical protein
MSAEDMTESELQNRIANLEQELHPMRRARDAHSHRDGYGPAIVSEETQAHIRHLEGCIYAYKVELEKRLGNRAIPGPHPADIVSHNVRYGQ